MGTQPSRLRVETWKDASGLSGVSVGVDRVFFASSATQSFETDAARAAFRERWLGRYLETFPAWAYVALDADGEVAGYLVGSIEDPAKSGFFDDITYFGAFSSLTARFPAQLHVNMAPAWRSKGQGALLVERFCRDAAHAGVPGVHVVSSRDMRNIGFYKRMGFRDVGGLKWNGRELVFLGRELKPGK